VSTYDAIIIGSGFGGAMVAHTLVGAGLDVLMLERGDWVTRGPHNWDVDGTLDLTPAATGEPTYRVLAGGNKRVLRPHSCVGGPSVFYGGVALRFREGDFDAHAEIGGGAWPYAYDELEPYYARVEQLLGVAGEANGDPTGPFRSAPYPQALNGLSETSQRIERAARGLALRPFRLPLAINYDGSNGRRACVGCTTCDTFACAIEAKNDLATAVLSPLLRRGLTLEHNTVVTRVQHHNGRARAVECYDTRTGERREHDASVFVLSAGALGSPHLLLASELDKLAPSGHLIGRYLMRHCSGIVFGVFARPPNKLQQFHKQLGIHDFYFGHPTVTKPTGKLGGIQQLQTPPIGLVRDALPPPLGRMIGPVIDHLTGLLVMAEDQAQIDNGLAVDWGTRDHFGMPQLTIEHRYSARDLQARRALVKKSQAILRRAGARFTYVHDIKTFSHAVGTARFGTDPETSVLDPFCALRGAPNLYVVDGSFMPTSAGVNPSLTISANALRVGEKIATS
jgi:choline dehydrogenase-like flavoprotein